LGASVIFNVFNCAISNLVLTRAATALRSSEILALRWSDVLWDEGRTRISKRWAKGEDGETKTDVSDGSSRYIGS
jgi:integrase